MTRRELRGSGHGDPPDETRDSAQARARAAEQRFQLVVESVRDYAIFVLDPSGRVATWNAGAKLIKGYLAEEVIGKDISIFYAPDDLARGRPRALLDAALSEGRVEDEGWRVRKDGSRFWADVVITAIRDPQGQLQGFVKVTRDLTLRKDAEGRLRQSEESLAATLYSIGDAVLATDEEARVTRINPVAERLTGWSEREAIGRPIDEVFASSTRRPVRRRPILLAVCWRKAWSWDSRITPHSSRAMAPSGPSPIAARRFVMHGRNTRGGAGLQRRDQGTAVRRRARKSQEEVRLSEESLRATLYSIGDAVLATDEQGRVTRINPVAERLTGWPEKEAIGRPIVEVFNIVNEETRARAVNPVTRVLSGGRRRRAREPHRTHLARRHRAPDRR